MSRYLRPALFAICVPLLALCFLTEGRRLEKISEAGLPISGYVLANGRVATAESVLLWCGGDTAVLRERAVYKRGVENALPKLQRDTEALYNFLNLWTAPCIFSLFALGMSFWKRSRIWIWAFVSAGIQMVCFAATWMLFGKFPVESTGQTMAFAGMAVSLIAVGFAFKGSRPKVCALLALSAILNTAAMAMWQHPSAMPHNPALSSALLPWHVTAIIAGYACLVSSPVCGRKMLWAGVVLLTAGTVLGAIWADTAWGAWWSWDPKESAALATIVLSALLGVCWNTMQQRGLLWVGYVVVVIAVAATWFLTPLLPGMHSYS